MVLRLRTWPLRIVFSCTLVLGFALASWAALRPWIAQRIAGVEPDENALRHALTIDPDNGRLHAMRATLYHYSLLLRDYPAALTAYRSALRMNPLNSASWLHIGKLYADLDQARESDQAFALSARFGPSHSGLLWEIATAHLEEGHVTEAISTLTSFLAASPPHDLIKGYDLARRLASPDELLDKMIAPDLDHYTHYANYLLDRKIEDQALAVWDRMPQMAARTQEPIDPHLQLRVVDLLMATGRLDQAYRLWITLVTQTQPDAAPTASNLASNGNFERKETVGRGFDWRIGGAPGVAWAFDPDISYTGRRSLRLSFVKSRADYSNVSQLIPVQPHSMYALQAHIKTDGLAGSKGITLEVIDSAEGAMAKTDTVGGTRDWSQVTVNFQTSATARTITLKVHSEPPPPYLPPLSGSAWIDNVSLVKVE
jgi:hypothetical protein